MTSIPFAYQPLGWQEDLTADDYKAHIAEELSKHSVEPRKTLGELHDVWRSLNSWAPTLNEPYKCFFKLDDDAQHPDEAQLELSVSFSENQLGYFAATWQPTERTRRKFALRGDYDPTIGSRPPNEIIHVPDMPLLKFPIERMGIKGRDRSPTAHECVVSDLLCLLRAATDLGVRSLAQQYTVTRSSAFHFDLADKKLSRQPTVVRNFVVDWKIVMAEPKVVLDRT